MSLLLDLEFWARALAYFGLLWLSLAQIQAVGKGKYISPLATITGFGVLWFGFPSTWKNISVPGSQTKDNSTTYKLHQVQMCRLFTAESRGRHSQCGLNERCRQVLCAQPLVLCGHQNQCTRSPSLLSILWMLTQQSPVLFVSREHHIRFRITRTFWIHRTGARI